MNTYLNHLQPYPFERLKALFANVTPPSDKKQITLSIGEPQHTFPQFVNNVLSENQALLNKYPTTKGTDELRLTIANWLEKRFNLPQDSLNPNDNVLPVNGTREALFAIGQCLVSANKDSLVMMPNPFYQIYEGAALLAGATPYFLSTQDNSDKLDIDSISDKDWARCEIIYLCSPGNPTGTVISEETQRKLINLAQKHNFVVISDECYSEIYQDEDNPPLGLLETAYRMGNHGFKNCLAFHSLSKRSNLPGLRSGFVAGDASVLDKFLLYRTYHGCSMSLLTQKISVAAWQDENHVKENRERYRQKFSHVYEILSDCLPVQAPPASFYLWPETPISDEAFAKQLLERENVVVLPGRYLARDTEQGNPGKNRIRIALVAELEECITAAQRIKSFIQHL